MHDYVRQKEGSWKDKKDFCNYVLKMPGSPNPCEQRYPHQRYFQLNLVPLHKFGTIEFRAHSSTYDPERIFRYGQLMLAFVEHFGRGNGRQSMRRFFSGSKENDYTSLANEQRKATADELFRELGNLVDSGSKSFFTTRSWEKGDAFCNPNPDIDASVVQPSCRPKSMPGGFTGFPGDIFTGLPGLFGGGGGFFGSGFVQVASNVSQSGDEQTLRIPVHSSITPGSFMQVMMPEGNVRVEQVNATASAQGYHEFLYNPTEESTHREMSRSLRDGADGLA
jgi:hypothetical protein